MEQKYFLKDKIRDDAKREEDKLWADHCSFAPDGKDGDNIKYMFEYYIIYLSNIKW